MRLEMRSLVGLAAAVSALLLSASCCCKAPYLVGDTISGGASGYAFVKVVVTLANNAAGKCAVLDVQPETVHVFPGSAIRWWIVNTCDAAGAAKRRVKFTNPAPRAGGHTASASSTPESFAFAHCSSEVQVSSQKDPSNVLLCEVPDNARYGLYKYGLEGDIEPKDPGLEVHGPGR